MTDQALTRDHARRMEHDEAHWARLPALSPTHIVEGREQRVFRMPPGPDRWKERSRFFPGIAAAMADQWGGWASREAMAA